MWHNDFIIRTFEEMVRINGSLTFMSSMRWMSEVLSEIRYRFCGQDAINIDKLTISYVPISSVVGTIFERRISNCNLLVTLEVYWGFLRGNGTDDLANSWWLCVFLGQCFATGQQTWMRELPSSRFGLW